MFWAFNAQLDQLFLTPFGNHELCGDGVGMRKIRNLSATETYLVVIKDLAGSGLQAFLTETLECYLCDDVAPKNSSFRIYTEK